MVEAPTKEQRADALSHTREVLSTVRDVMRELDVPAAEFGTVLALYSNQLYASMHKDDHKKYVEREKKVRAIVKEREAEAVKQFGSAANAAMVRQDIPMGGGLGGYMGAYSPIEDQVRAELALEDEI